MGRKNGSSGEIKLHYLFHLPNSNLRWNDNWYENNNIGRLGKTWNLEKDLFVFLCQTYMNCTMQSNRLNLT